MANAYAHVDPWMERRLVATLAYRPGEIADFHDLDDILADPLARHAWQAVKQVKAPNPVDIAHAMNVANDKEATPDNVRHGILDLASEDFETINPLFLHDTLMSLARVRNAAPLYEQFGKEVQVRKLSPLDAWVELGDKLHSIPGSEDEVETWNTDQLTPEWRLALAAQQAKLAKESHLATWPDEFTVLRNRVEFLVGRMIGLLMDTGAGKTIFASDILPHHWAANCGRNVDVFLTETSTEEINWRHEIREVSRQNLDTEPPTLDQLEKGYVDDRILRITRPYPCGRVNYIQAGGMRLEAVLARARRDRADIVLDVAHDIRFPRTRAERQDEAIANGLVELAKYAKQFRANVVYTVQTDKVGRRESRSMRKLDASDVSGGAVWENKADLFLIGSFPRITDPANLINPFTSHSINIRPPTYSPLGEFLVVKGRKGGSGYSQLIWREGRCFDIRAIPPNLYAFYTEQLEALRA